jgi:hypothetical protein
MGAGRSHALADSVCSHGSLLVQDIGDCERPCKSSWGGRVATTPSGTPHSIGHTGGHGSATACAGRRNCPRSPVHVEVSRRPGRTGRLRLWPFCMIVVISVWLERRFQMAISSSVPSHGTPCAIQFPEYGYFRRPGGLVDDLVRVIERQRKHGPGGLIG